MEVIVASGERCVALDGSDGGFVWQTSNLDSVDSTTQPQIANLDDDPFLEIVVPRLTGPTLDDYSPSYSNGFSGFYILDGENGDIEQYFTVPGRCDNSPVIGKIDGEGDYPTIFFASTTFVEITDDQNSRGFLRSYKYNPSIGGGEYELLNSQRIWHPCSGGLALADADHDGVFEVYMNDRDYYNDRGYDAGVISFWASNLTERWRNPDMILSSHIPIIADVTKDGILDVIVTPQRGGMAVIDAIDGHAITKDQSVNVDGDRISGHYQSSVYDIDSDGNLEILVGDGSHSITWDIVVFDLVDWTVDARIPEEICGQSFYGPQVGDVYGNDGIMDIVVVNYTSVLVFDGSHDPSVDGTYPLVWDSGVLFPSGYTRCMYAVMQDIDNDDLTEIVVFDQRGAIYAFETETAAPDPLPRTEVQFYSERRMGAAEYVPGLLETPEPLVVDPTPARWQRDVPISTSEITFTLSDYQGDTIDYEIVSTPDITGGLVSDSDVDSGTPVSISISGLVYDTVYNWTISVTDGASSYELSHYFITEPEPIPGSNVAPSQTQPLLTADPFPATTESELTAYNQTTDDSNDDPVTNVYDWRNDGNSLASLNMPFDTKSTTTVKDYSTYGNDGELWGNVSWTEDGVVGGAYEFNHGFITIPDDVSLDGDYDLYEMTAELWVYLNEDQVNTRVMFKQPCYQIGFRDTSTPNQLFGLVWTTRYDGSERVARENEVRYDTPLSLNTWYHIAMTYSETEGTKLYVNGVLEDTRGPDTSDDAEGYIQRSREPVLLGWFEPYNGRIDEVKIYNNTCLTAEQIYQNYMQTKDGLSDSSVLVPQTTSGNDHWTCAVTPSDGMVDGGTLISNLVNLENGVPVASDAVIGPRFGTTALVGEDLVAIYQYFDPDGDAESSTEIRWYNEGTLVPAYNDDLTIPSGELVVGESWYFTVRPYDGTDFGDTVTSETVTLRDNVVPTHDNPTLVSSDGGNTNYEDLITEPAGTSDTDGDDVTNIYNWLKDGQSITALNMPFDTESWTTVADYSGNGNDGALTTPEWTSEGIVGGAYEFDGTDVLTIADSASLGNDGTWSEITLELWVKPAMDQNGARIINKNGGNAGSSGKYMLGFNTNGPANVVFFGITTDESYEETYDSAETVISSGVWSHILATYNSGEGIKIYINGVLKAQNLGVTGNIDSSVGEDLFLGYAAADPGTENRYFNGTLDEVRVYNRALSAQQAMQRYMETKDGLSSSSTIVDNELTVGDQWSCQVTPSDAIADGTMKTTNEIEIVEGELTLSTEDSTGYAWFDDDTVITSLAEVEVDVDDDGDVEIVTAGYANDGVKDNAMVVVWDGSTIRTLRNHSRTIPNNNHCIILNTIISITSSHNLNITIIINIHQSN